MGANTDNGAAGRLSIILKNNTVASIVLLAAEIWLGYLFWSVHGYFFFQVYFYTLSVTGAVILSYLYFLVFFIPFLFCIPGVSQFIGRNLSFFRLPAIISLLLTLAQHDVRAVFSCIGVAGLQLAFGAACSNHFVGSDGVCGQEPSHHLTAQCRHVRYLWGLVGGLLLLWILRMGFMTADPQYHYALSYTVVFFLVGVAAFVSVLTSEIADKKNEQLQENIQSTKKHLPRNELKLPNRILRELAWIPTSLFLAGTIFIIYWVFTQPEALPRFVGITHDSTLGWGWGIILAYIAGMLLAPTVFNGILWFLLLIIGCGLAGAVLNGGGYVGGLFIAFALPSMLFYTFSEISRIARYGVALGVGFVLLLIYLICTFGVLFGAGSPLGVPFHHEPSKLLWLTVLLMALLLIVMHIINNLDEDDRSFASPKKVFKGLLGSPKPVRPPTEVLVGVGLILLLGICLVIARASMYSQKLEVLPVNNESLKVMTFNIYQGATTTGEVNVRKVVKVLQEYNPHLAGFQESDAVHVGTSNLDPITYISGSLQMDAFFGIPNAESSAGASLVSRTMMGGHYAQPMAANSDTSLIRPFVQAEIYYNNTKITVFVVHVELFEWSPKDVDDQIDFIVSKITSSSGPLLLLGDFNCLPDSPQIAKIRAAGLICSYEEYNNINTTVINLKDYNATYPSDDQYIDYIFYRELVLVDAGIFISKDSELHGTSDHLPVYASFKLY